MRIPTFYLPLLLLLMLCFACPNLVQADVTSFPIPAISTSKNDGRDFGLIIPTLITGPDGDLKYLIAPMVVYNSFVGTRGTFNLFRYEPGGKELKGLASWSERIERKFLLSYIDPGFSNGRYSIGTTVAHFKNATMRFLDLAPRPSKEIKPTTRPLRRGQTGNLVCTPMT